MERFMMQNQSNAGITQYPEIPKGKNVQVESIRREDIGWMAGIIDGEGTIGLALQSLYRGFKITKERKDGTQREYGDYQYPMLAPYISITSTSFELLRKYTEILSMLGVHYHYLLNSVSKKHKNWHDSVCVRVSRVNSVYKLLSIIRPYLSEKRPRADLVWEFCQWKINLRLEWKTKHAENRNSLGQIQPGRVLTPEQNEVQKEYWERFKNLPAKQPNIPLSETIRLGSRPIEIKI